MLFSQGNLLNTAPPPIFASLFAFIPAMPAMPAIPPEPEDGGVVELPAAAGGDELDPEDGGTKEVLFDPALEADPALEDVLFELAVEPAAVVELDPADELVLGEESESGKGGTAAPGEEALESGLAGAGEEAFESGLAGAGEEALESGLAGAGEEELDAGVDAPGLDELESAAGLDPSPPAPGSRLLMLLGSISFSFARSNDNMDWKADVMPAPLDASGDLALPPRSPDSIPVAPLPDAVPAPVPGLSADGGEASVEGGDAPLDGISG
ncbi:hypothetical protein BLS_008363 [Venturia inaequalis]|uniref:Uncharacterized protein n=1 Tax=Venturia inaequalis TaxID=5025 RepID=A0A8H3U6F7_VENIN|nr:hypothetical protein BLS_008363 [Venturia inaequalis]